MTELDCRGQVPESWACVDCDFNTAPGLKNRAQMEAAFMSMKDDEGVAQTIDEFSEVYAVKPAVWKASGVDGFGGCLCIGCLEQRIGRKLTPKDFRRRHPFSQLPGTKRLLSRRDGDRCALRFR